MTNGQLLKKNLHLQNFKYVRIRRIITGGSEKCYQIAFDSRNPARPLTTYLLNNSILVPSVFDGSAIQYSALPWVDIEIFNGLLNPCLFFVCDISGLYGKTKNYSEKVYIHKETLQEVKLEEYVTLSAFTAKGLVSDITQKYKDIRQSTGQVKIKGKTVANTANVNTKLIQTEIIDNDVIFKFLTEATEMYPKNHKFSQINPSTKEFETNSSKTYEIWIKLLNVVGENGWLSTFDTTKEILTQKDIKDILDVSNVQLWSNSPSWQYQGFNYWAKELDASIFPNDTPTPKFWDKKHGDGQAFLDKHTSQLIDQLPFFRNQMASALTNALRKAGYLSPYRRKK